MRLRNGRQIDVRADSNGDKGYVFWQENSFSPLTYFVRGDSFDDAYAWLLCDPRYERRNTLEAVYGDGETISAEMMTYLLRDFEEHGATFDAIREAMSMGEVSGWSINDNGTIVYSEDVNGMSLSSFCRETDR